MAHISRIRTLLADPSIERVESVQSLWSGYGEIIRCRSQLNNRRIIVKSINFESPQSHPRGWNTNASHNRKTHSYQVELAFYKHYAAQTNEHCRVPQLLAIDETKRNTLLVMEDLDESGLIVRCEDADWQTLQVAIRWLAHFHATFMHCDGQTLWPIGSYWHLATRQDELNAMPASPFKTYAQDIDDALNSAQFKTFVHGDAKFANLCFHHDKQRVAAVDFQYVGTGSGVKDLAYLVGSGLREPQLKEYEARILEEYLTQIRQAFAHYNKEIDFERFEAETRFLYPVAWADFYRFLLGWNPKSWKIGPYMDAISHQGLASLNKKS